MGSLHSRALAAALFMASCIVHPSARAASSITEYDISGAVFDPSASVHQVSGSGFAMSLDVALDQSITFNTINGTYEIFDDNDVSITGLINVGQETDEDGNLFSIYNFSSISIASTASINIISSTNDPSISPVGIALISEGDINIEANIDATGADGTEGNFLGAIFGFPGLLPYDGTDVSIVSKGTITLSGDINTSGGNGGNIYTNDPGGDPGGDAGAVTLSSLVLDITSDIIANGGDGGRGRDSIQGGSNSAQDAGGDGGNGGDVAITASELANYDGTSITNNGGVTGTGNNTGSSPPQDGTEGMDPNIAIIDGEPTLEEPPIYLIPEPSSIFMLAFSGLAFLTRRSRKAA